MRAIRLRASVAICLLAIASASSQAAQTIRIGLIEPFSGPIAGVGVDALQSFQYHAARVNERGGVLGGRHLEIVPLDNAMNAEKTTQQLKKAVDTGVHYIAQGIGSNHALNIIKFVDRNNKRNPDAAIVFLNHSAVTTAFTNELCSFWHFRFDANVDMKTAALVTQMSQDASVRKVYMLNQNYAYGKSVQASARAMLAERATGIELVGDELIVPFGKVQDFTPFIAKIKASGADTILTGNWGPDMVRFAKGATGAGLDTQFYTIYGGLPSSVAGYGDDAGKLRLKQVTEAHQNHPGLPDNVQRLMVDYVRVNEDSWYSDRQRWLIEMLAAAIDKAGSDQPVAVARALEGITFDGPLGQVQMRAADHQIQLPLVVSTLTPRFERPIVHNGRDFQMAFSTDGVVARKDTTLATTCAMERPDS